MLQLNLRRPMNCVLIFVPVSYTMTIILREYQLEILLSLWLRAVHLAHTNGQLYCVTSYE